MVHHTKTAVRTHQNTVVIFQLMDIQFCTREFLPGFENALDQLESIDTSEWNATRSILFIQSLYSLVFLILGLYTGVDEWSVSCLKKFIFLLIRAEFRKCSESSCID